MRRLPKVAVYVVVNHVVFFHSTLGLSFECKSLSLEILTRGFFCPHEKGVVHETGTDFGLETLL